MKDIPFVTEEQLQISRDMEAVALRFPDAMVLFVGVRVSPSSTRDPVYFVSVGCPPSIDPAVCASVIYYELRKHWALEDIDVTAYRGAVKKQNLELTVS